MKSYKVKIVCHHNRHIQFSYVVIDSQLFRFDATPGIGFIRCGICGSIRCGTVTNGPLVAGPLSFVTNHRGQTVVGYTYSKQIRSYHRDNRRRTKQESYPHLPPTPCEQYRSNSVSSIYIGRPDWFLFQNYHQIQPTNVYVSVETHSHSRCIFHREEQHRIWYVFFKRIAPVDIEGTQSYSNHLLGCCSVWRKYSRYVFVYTTNV